jgi:hypothetical protein
VEWIRELSLDDYEVLLQMMQEEQERRDRD